MNYFTLRPSTHLHGDYGNMLVHGMGARLPRVDGRLQLERVGPYVPRLSLPGPGRLVATRAWSDALTAAGLAGFDVAALDVVRAVRIDWLAWDSERFEFPERGEPEDYILGRPHDPALAKELPELVEWRLRRLGFARVERLGRGPTPRKFYVGQVGGARPDVFQAENGGWIFVSARLRARLEDDSLCFAFEDVVFE